MRTLELTLPTAAENVALDDALLQSCQSRDDSPQVLRLWEPARPLVVIGRSSKINEEVHREACRQAEIPVLRRCSGGAAIVTGPGCLMYAVLLDLERQPELRAIDAAHRYVMRRLQQACNACGRAVAHQGHCDLTLNNRKVSGNSLRISRTFLLYHGTLLVDFDLSLIAELLGTPPRQPAYRRGRDHGTFVANLGVSMDALKTALRTAFTADEPLTEWPAGLTSQLVGERYSRETWNASR